MDFSFVLNREMNVRAAKKCSICSVCTVAVKRTCSGELLCSSCFFDAVEMEVHQTIVSQKLFCSGDVIAVGASGGKDSTVLVHLLTHLNAKYHYGIEIILISIDEGISGYRDQSLEAVRRNAKKYDLPLLIVSYKDLFGWTMDEVVEQVGRRSNCTYCGVFRRQALDRAATLAKACKIATGHNADDIAETIVMNVLRSDIPRLSRCSSVSADRDGSMPRIKPLRYVSQKEIVLYAHFQKLDYFSTECSYSTEAFRGNARSLLKEIESLRQQCISDAVYSGEHVQVRNMQSCPQNVMQPCTRCGYVTSQKLCRACVLLDQLNAGKPKLVLTSADV